jgi:citrate lyase beta subunit
VRAAQRIIAAASDGTAVRLDGHMIDKPAVDRARLVLHRADLLSEEGDHKSKRS